MRIANQEKIKMSQKSKKTPTPTRKRKVKRGILGYPKAAKKDRVLFFVKDFDSSESDEEDETLDPDFTPLEEADKEETNKRKHIEETVVRKKLKPTSSCPRKKKSIEETLSDWSDRMPYELLFKIFQYYMSSANGDIRELDRLKSVCEYWSKVAEDPRLWSQLDFSKLLPLAFIQQKSTSSSSSQPSPFKLQARFQAKLKSLLSSSVFKNNLKAVRVLNLSNLACLDCDSLDSILSSCDSALITGLSLSNCPRLHSSTKSQLFEVIVANYCPNLVSLNLDSLDKQINVKGISKLLEVVGPKLKILSLARNHLPRKILNIIGDNCPELEELDISLSKLEQSGATDFDYLSEKCSKLKRLYLHGSSYKSKYASVQSVLTSPEAFKNLEEFSLADSSLFYGENRVLYTMLKLSKDSEKLTSIQLVPYRSPLDCHMNYFSFFKTNSLTRLFMPRSSLSEADSMFLAEAIASKWSTSLVYVNLEWSSISLPALQVMIDGFVKRSSESRLRTLHLTGTCVTTEMILKLVKNVSSIKLIDLNSCRSVERGMKRVLDQSDIKKLFED